MKEDFLHFIWKHQKFDFRQLRTTEQQTVSVVHIGNHNFDAGPDFLQAKLQIDNQLWAGQVEIHKISSDWNLHKHNQDQAYENVILHVVWKEDQIIYNHAGVRIPCIELYNKVDELLLQKYQHLIESKSWIACAQMFDSIDQDKFRFWLIQMAVQRLQEKTDQIKKQKVNEVIHWEQLFFERLCYSFGLRVNQEAFESMARRTPVELIWKYTHNPVQINALLFGQSGLLHDRFQDDYPKKLYAEYQFLRHKHNLVPIPKIYWKFARLRPANFPTLRIAQLVQLLVKHKRLFRMVLEEPIEIIMTIFSNIRLTEYWASRYIFDQDSKHRNKSLGKERVFIILINCVVPILFLYGREKSEEKYVVKALTILEQLKPEKNSIIKHWNDLGFRCDNALESQSLLQLKKAYCDKYKCTNCHVGHALLDR